MADNVQNHLFGGQQQESSPSPFYMGTAQAGYQESPQQSKYQGWPAQQAPQQSQPQFQGYQQSPQPPQPQPLSSPSGLDFYSAGSMPDAGGIDENVPVPAHIHGYRNDNMAGLFDQASLEEDYANEPPLLEELDIHFEHILGKTKQVLQPFKAHHAKAPGMGTGVGPTKAEEAMLMDSDLTGPIFFLLCLGGCLLLQGKVQFGSIYGFGVFGCASLYVLLNLLSPPQAPPIDFWQVVSTLGYCLLPVVLVAVVGIVFSLTGLLGNFVAGVAIVWCTWTATRNFERLLSTHEQRFLIAYPIGLLYSIFVLITIF